MKAKGGTWWWAEGINKRMGSADMERSVAYLMMGAWLSPNLRDVRAQHSQIHIHARPTRCGRAVQAGHWDHIVRGEHWGFCRGPEASIYHDKDARHVEPLCSWILASPRTFGNLTTSRMSSKCTSGFATSFRTIKVYKLKANLKDRLTARNYGLFVTSWKIMEYQTAERKREGNIGHWQDGACSGQASAASKECLATAESAWFPTQDQHAAGATRWIGGSDQETSRQLQDPDIGEKG